MCFVAFWLAATQHCGLEAAGLAPDHPAESSAACCADTESCHNDACDLVESGLYKLESQPAAVAPPQLAPDFQLLWLTLSAARFDEVEPPPECDRTGRVLAWIPTRHFMQRAAPSPRAPSLFA